MKVRNENSILRWMACSLVIGCLIGLVVNNRLDIDARDAKWVSIIGNYYAKLLCGILTLVLGCSMVLATSALVRANFAKSVFSKAILYMLCTTCIAAGNGTFWAYLFREQFQVTGENYIQGTSMMYDQSRAMVQFQCANGKVMQEDASLNGTITCSGTFGSTNASLVVIDNNGVLMDAFDHIGDSFTFRSFADLIRSTIKHMIPHNVLDALVGDNVLCILTTAIVCGIVATKTTQRKFHHGKQKFILTGRNHILTLSRQLLQVLLHIMQYVYRYAPHFAFMIIVGTLLQSKEQLNRMAEMVPLVTQFITVVVCASMTQLLIINPFIMFVTCFNRRDMSTWEFLKLILPAQMFALTLSSSLLALPTTTQCVRSANLNLSKAHRDVILSLGAAINMDGVALYVPITIVFIAFASGHGATVFPDSTYYIQLFFYAVVSSISCIPLPNANMLTIVSVWRSMTTIPLPSSFIIVYALEFITDRIETTVNITGDAILCYIISFNIPRSQCGKKSTSQTRFTLQDHLAFTEQNSECWTTFPPTTSLDIERTPIPVLLRRLSSQALPDTLIHVAQN